MNLILASSSPRRKLLLKNAGYKFKIVKSSYKENNSENLSPLKLTKKHALNKALDVSKKIKEGLVIGADTIVVLKNEIIGKPKDKSDAKSIISRLSGKSHYVITSFAIIDAKTKKYIMKSVSTKVVFRKLSNNEIKDYIEKSDDYLDKAGAYHYDGEGRGFVKKVVGSKSNIVGLPIKEFKKAISNFDI